MSELFVEDPPLAEKLALYFLDCYNKLHLETFKFSKWADKKQEEGWDFLALNKKSGRLEIQIVDAPDSHSPSVLKKRNLFRRGDINSYGINAVEDEMRRIEAAVGHKSRGGKIVNSNLILLVTFNSYRSKKLPEMKRHLELLGLTGKFKEVWIIDETIKCDLLD